MLKGTDNDKESVPNSTVEDGPGDGFTILSAKSLFLGQKVTCKPGPHRGAASTIGISIQDLTSGCSIELPLRDAASLLGHSYRLTLDRH